MIHREDVTLEVRERESGKLIGTVQLENGVWDQWVSIGEYEPEDVYLVETMMSTEYEGDLIESDVYPTSSGLGSQWKENPTVDEDGEGTQIHRVDALYHSYEVTYQMERLNDVGQSCLYSVTNRRLGNVNITVTKEWIDGEGEQREVLQQALSFYGEQAPRLVLYLDFAMTSPESYQMSHSADESADWINIANEEAYFTNSSPEEETSVLDGKTILSVGYEEDKSTYYFTGLPKYDVHGEVARYEVKEIWVDRSNQVIDEATLQSQYPKVYEAYQPYSTTITSEYKAGSDAEQHLNDLQTVTIVNRLSGTKDVEWHKKWNDYYTNTEGRRPDIYLDLYRLVHTEEPAGSGNVTTKLESVIKNYRWWQEIDAGDTDFDWSATFTGLPKYDSLGYEIFYYAAEHTAVDTGLLEYVDVSYDMDGTALGTMYEPNETALNDENAYVQKLESDGDAGEKTEYALKEEGTFTNTLEGTISAVIQKRWENLPAGYATNGEDLPEVTFYLYRGTEVPVDTEDTASPVAQLTVSRDDWKNILKEGIYTFEFLYEGTNILTEDGKTELQSEGKFLSKYDPAGKLYHYALTEKIETTDDGLEMTAVYEDPTITGYTATNLYNSDKGSLAFKKILEIPAEVGTGDPEAYPAVEFEIGRQYKKNDGTLSPLEVISVVRSKDDAQNGKAVWEKGTTEGNLIWSSDEVESKYTSGDRFVEAEFVVNGLELYAPNGAEYIYQVEEIKTNLNDYLTWVKDGEITNEEAVEVVNDTDSAVSDPIKEEISLTPYASNAPASEVEISATFLNAQNADREEQILKGIKIWDDLEDIFGWRPAMPGAQNAEKPEFQVTVYREALTQPGENNAIAKTKLTEGTDYAIKWTEVAENSNQWEYTITGSDGKGLERFAPNGMEWKYTVEEKEPEHYTAAPANGIVAEAGTPAEVEGQTVQRMTNLTNSITTQAKFNKTWIDSNGETITEDYLGTALTVVFELQVKEESEDRYQSAREYFKDEAGLLKKIEQSNQDGGFDSGTLRWKLTGKLTDSVWKTGEAFEGLPAEIEKDGNSIKLTYRVVERAILFGEETGDYKNNIEVKEAEGGYFYSFDTSIEQLFSPYYQDGRGQEIGTKNANDPSGGIHSQYNRLQTSDITVTKRWEMDASNIYDTRPKAEDGSGYDWKTSFLIQRKDADGSADWENVLIGGNSNTPLIVDIYGNNEDDTASRTIEGLPMSGITDEGNVISYVYRVLELNSRDDVSSFVPDPAGDDDKYNSSYSVTYEEDDRTVTNALDDTKIYAEKIWIGNDPAASLTLELQYQKEDKSWSSFPTPARVTLNGDGDLETAAYRETTTTEDKNNGIWTAVWENVPKVYPGSKTDEDGNTIYQVVETTPSGYRLLEGTQNGTKVVDGVTYTVFRFENMKQVSLTVTKAWYGEKNPSDITVGLYRKAGESGDEEQVLGEDGNPVKGTLTATSSWEATFAGLPKYGKVNGQWVQYFYYAKEVTIGEQPADQTDYRILYENSPETLTGKPNSFQTAITNIGRMDIQGTKTWKDNENQYSTRPDDLNLTLYRSTADPVPEDLDDWAQVTKDILKSEGAKFEWVSKSGDAWTYRYTGLLSATDRGEMYTYRVEETLPKIEDTANPDVVETEDRYEQSKGTGDYDLVNTLTGKTEVTVTKTWADGGDADGFRGEITLELRADNVPIKTVTLDRTGVVSRILDAFTDSGNRWIYTFEDLDKYDANGKRIEYTVVETKFPDGYEQGNMEGDAQNGFSITNTLLTSVTVEKKWRGIRPENLPEISVGLYRKAENTAGQPEKVLDQDSHQLIAVLDRTTGWTYTFEDLPRFDENGQRYEYTVQEQLIGGKPAADSGFVVHTEGGMLTQGTGEGTWSYTITNIGGTEISGTKTWKDNSNAYGTRPKELELTLYRKTEGGQEEAVKEEWLKADGSELIWTKEGDVWSYTYTGLPLTDDHGAPYTYRVKETVPAGYVSDPADGFAGAEENYSFTNTLTDRIDIPVVKVWEDNGDSSGKRPDSIEVILYANGKEYRRVTVSKDTNGLAHVWNWITGGTDDEWKFEFTELPKYDADGVLIAYSIEEKVPDGYDGYYETEDGLVKIINLREGSLRVTKRVSGTAGDTGRRFRFTLTLSDTSINGTYGEMEFVNGVAEIRLRHGESATASGLPAGIGYRISEEDVSENGYTTWAENASGEIVLDGTANAVFHNHRNLPEEDDDEEDPVVPVQPEKPAAPGAALPVLPGIAIPDTATVPASAQTGDFATPALYTGLAALACGSIAGILVSRRCRRKKKKRA